MKPRDITTIDHVIDALTNLKEKAVDASDYARAAKLRDIIGLLEDVERETP